MKAADVATLLPNDDQEVYVVDQDGNVYDIEDGGFEAGLGHVLRVVGRDED